MALIAQDPLGTNYSPGTLVGTGATPNWAAVPGKAYPVIQSPGSNYISSCAHSPSRIAASRWAGTALPSDQWAEIAHNPTFITSGELAKGAAPTVRNDPASDSCYALFTSYTELPGGWIGADGVSYGFLWQCVSRFNNGVETEIARFQVPGWTWADDWWFGCLEVWGVNPVRLRVINKAPTIFVPGTDNAGASPGAVGQLPAECDYVSNGTTYNSESWRMFGAPACVDLFESPPTSGAVAWDSSNARLSEGRTWVVWEGADASAGQIATGQPGFRWGNPNYFGAAKFSAGSIDDRLTCSPGFVSSGQAVLSGYRVPGSTVTVT